MSLQSRDGLCSIKRKFRRVTHSDWVTHFNFFFSCSVDGLFPNYVFSLKLPSKERFRDNHYETLWLIKSCWNKLQPRLSDDKSYVGRAPVSRQIFFASGVGNPLATGFSHHKCSTPSSLSPIVFVLRFSQVALCSNRNSAMTEKRHNHKPE